MLGITLYCSSTIFLEADSLNQTQSSPIWFISLASLLWGIPYVYSEVRITDGHFVHSAFTWVLGIRTLVLMVMWQGPTH